MASSGAAEKPKYHDGKLKPYPHEELGREVGKHFFWHTIMLPFQLGFLCGLSPYSCCFYYSSLERPRQGPRQVFVVD